MAACAGVQCWRAVRACLRTRHPRACARLERGQLKASQQALHRLQRQLQPGRAVPAVAGAERHRRAELRLRLPASSAAAACTGRTHARGWASPAPQRPRSTALGGGGRVRTADERAQPTAAAVQAAVSAHHAAPCCLCAHGSASPRRNDQQRRVLCSNCGYKLQPKNCRECAVAPPRTAPPLFTCAAGGTCCARPPSRRRRRPRTRRRATPARSARAQRP